MKATRAQIKQEIAIIRKCEKSIYDYEQRQLFVWSKGVCLGLIRAEAFLCRKRKRLEAKLK